MQAWKGADPEDVLSRCLTNRVPVRRLSRGLSSLVDVFHLLFGDLGGWGRDDLGTPRSGALG